MVCKYAQNINDFMHNLQLILDTNFLILAHRFKIKVFEELDRLIEEKYEPVISEKIVDEIRAIARSKKRENGVAKVVLKLIKKYCITVEKSKEQVDKWILKKAKGNMICTNDKELKKRLKLLGARVISVKGKSKLGFV